MNDQYLDALGRELSAAGIVGRRRTRILTEFKDHLECEPNAQLGAPAELARQFADELGTSRVRRSAVTAFAALAVAGILFGLVFITPPGRVFGGLGDPHSAVLASLAAIVAVLAPQVAFVAGLLAILRAFHRRRNPSVPRAEAIVMIRRAAVGLLSGAAAMVAIAALALEFRHGISSSWRTFAVVAAGVSVVALVAAIPSLLAATRLVPTGSGDAGDIFDDVGPFTPPVLNGRPWRFAIVVAALVGLAVAFVGIVGSDPYDGILRGVAEMIACLAGFAILGPYLGLWSPRPSGA